VNKKLSICGVEIDRIEKNKLISILSSGIENNQKIVISYLTTASLNTAINSSKAKTIFQQIDIIHPDGIGIYLASKYLYGKNGLKERITGSDFYLILIKEGIKNNWKFFFFGDTDETLKKVRENRNQLGIVGMQNGYNYKNEDLLIEISKSQPDILVVGLGCPLQEEWIIKYKGDITAKIIIAVGDGIKVFAGIKKRGPVLLQKLGFEWIVRLFLYPRKFWKRYLLGIPLFIYRVIKYKFQMPKETSKEL